MIRHIAFFSVRDSADIDLVIETLRGYQDIDEVESLEVARNDRCDDLDQQIDVVLHATFRDREALDRYKAHPRYIAGIDVIRPRRKIRHVVDYEVPDES
ncbi:MAG: Dabb family protein [Planctomycetota bacterium]